MFGIQLDKNALTFNGQTRNISHDALVSVFRVFVKDLSGKNVDNVTSLNKLSQLVSIEFLSDSSDSETQSTPVQVTKKFEVPSAPKKAGVAATSAVTTPVSKAPVKTLQMAQKPPVVSNEPDEDDDDDEDEKVQVAPVKSNKPVEQEDEDEDEEDDDEEEEEDDEDEPAPTPVKPVQKAAVPAAKAAITAPRKK